MNIFRAGIDFFLKTGAIVVRPLVFYEKCHGITQRRVIT